MRDLAARIAAWFQASRRRLHGCIPASVRGIFRRAGYFLPNREAQEYKTWMAQHLKVRASSYDEPLENGLLSVLTPVWDGSPVRYLKTLANSLVAQNRDAACEWVILDNGSSQPGIRSYLNELTQHHWIRLQRFDRNAGIVDGLRDCLTRATGRYVLPVDADDYLYPDALRVVTSFIRRTGYPPLLYTDEDKIIGSRFYQPYLKPDWDPVLFLNSAYIAHLGVIDRQKALALGAYEDPQTEGSPDWDVFMRFMMAGYGPVHIPEVVYSWRSHARSTADDAASKPYVHSSQKAVLQRFLNAQSDPPKFKIEYSPLLGGAAHWHFARQHHDPKPFVSVVLCHGSCAAARNGNASGTSSPETRTVHIAATENPQALLSIAREAALQQGFLRFLGGDVQTDDSDWAWEALGLSELHPDTAMIGGRIRNPGGVITEAGRHFGFRGVCGCPNRGRSFQDAGYFAQMWKQQSVSAVSSQFAIIEAEFLLQVLRNLPPQASLAFLGAWAGAHALRIGRRVVYSPFLGGVSDLDWETLISPAEKSLFGERNRDIIPDRRFYSRYFSLEEPFALEPETTAQVWDAVLH